MKIRQILHRVRVGLSEHLGFHVEQLHNVALHRNHPVLVHLVLLVASLRVHAEKVASLSLRPCRRFFRGCCCRHRLWSVLRRTLLVRDGKQLSALQHTGIGGFGHRRTISLFHQFQGRGRLCRAFTHLNLERRNLGLLGRGDHALLVPSFQDFFFFFFFKPFFSLFLHFRSLPFLSFSLLLHSRRCPRHSHKGLGCKTSSCSSSWRSVLPTSFRQNR